MARRDDGDEIERICRLNGQQPTAREKWRAFHRLWRIAHFQGAHQDMAAGDCFRVLFPDWRFIHLIDGRESDGYVDQSHVPTFLRKQMLGHRRKRRLYAGHYEWMEQDKLTAQKCRDRHGIEVTPTEVAEVRHKVLQLVRSRAAALDVRLPADDGDVLKWLAGREARRRASSPVPDVCLCGATTIDGCRWCPACSELGGES